MKYRRLGNTGLRVSALGLGCNNLGVIPECDAQALVGGALEVGVNFFDTADIYADGQSESSLGRLLAGRRSDVILATKFGHPKSVDNERPASRSHIMRAVHGSLKRLRTDWIDLYQVHFPDPLTPLEETLRALDDLVSSGKVRFIGCSNYSGHQLMDSLEQAGQFDVRAFATCQCLYNLIAREAENDQLPVAEAHGMGVLPFFPLSSGLLTGKYTVDPPRPDGVRARVVSGFVDRFFTERNLSAVARLKSWAQPRGWILAQLAITWLLARDSVSSVFAGATTQGQLLENVRATELQLDDADLRTLSALSSGDLHA